MARLSTKDKEKPFILIGAVVTGVVIQRIIGREVPQLIYLIEIGVFFVILVVMLPVEIRDVGRAFKKVKHTAIALFINFIFIPTFSWTTGWLILKNYPDFWVGAILYTFTPCSGGISGHPLVYLAIILGPVVKLPILLFLSRVLLSLREKWN